MSGKKQADDPPPSSPPKVQYVRTTLVIYLWIGTLLLLLIAGCASYASADPNRSGRISTGTLVLLALLTPLLTLGFAALLARLIWRRLYAPLLVQIQQMQGKINKLTEAAARNGKQMSRLETDKLRSQINPHFVHNTLNTVQWLARLNGQQEIDRLVTLLVKVLHYNLGKQSRMVTIGEEIEAVRHYMQLQRIRYDYEFELHVEAEAEMLNAAVPRFILQPLVENSIYHGLSGSGRIDVTAAAHGAGGVLLCVRDNGAGMDQTQIDELLAEETVRGRGLGIGFAYVLRTLRVYYGERMSLEIISGESSGTTVSILIPRTSKEDYDD